MARLDPHSFHDSDQPALASLSLHARVDFPTRTVAATVELTLARPGSGPLDLDTRDLAIASIREGEKGAGGDDGGGAALRFELSPPDPIRGSRLRIFLPEGTERLTVRYRTAPEATALQWLEPAQTAGGRHPFLFSQCQAIHARSLVPIQDTPRIRVRYRAALDIPAELRALMAAEFVRREEHGDRAVEHYRMDQPIPPYLLALAAGNLEAREVGPRSRVWAEPEVIEAAAWEFAGVEPMLATAERLFGPYLWDRFDILTMPPSFPYGGMENPRLTFLTPTLLAGDRSLVSVVAHELAHSWTGNLVTNASAEHFWLNEGFTVFAERRIVEALEGPEAAALHAALGRRELVRTLAELADKPELQKLHQRLDDVHPDDAFSVVPYEKGYLFLRALEEAAGRERFSAFLREYVARFRFQSITSDELLAFIELRLPGIASQVGAEAWLRQPGLPDNAPVPRSARLEALARLGDSIPDEATAGTLSPAEWRLYLESLPHPFAGCEELQARFHFDESHNYEVLVSWLVLAAESGHAPAVRRIEQALGEVGRMKYLKPLYLALARRPETRPLAGACYRRYRAGYHPIARMVVETILRNHAIAIAEVNPLPLARR